MTLGFLDAGDQVDILIIDNDIAPNTLKIGDVDAVRVDQRASIAQDIQHMIRESGLLRLLIAERDWQKRKLYINKIKRLVDEDIRLIAGTVEIAEKEISKNAQQTLWLSAKTEKYHEIGFYL